MGFVRVDFLGCVDVDDHVARAIGHLILGESPNVFLAEHLFAEGIELPIVESPLAELANECLLVSFEKFCYAFF